MPDLGLTLYGTEWEEWANQLLTLHYGPTNYVKISDIGGDGGLEGFTRNEGHAYQAYGAEPGKTAKQLYEAQRNKMTTDIGKFIKNRDVLSGLLGTTRITCWTLIVPTVGLKDIVAHSNAKTQEVRAASLPYVDTDFYVTVCDESSFAAERDRLLAYRTEPLFVDSEAPDDSALDNWADQNTALTQTLSSKLAKLQTMSAEDKRREFSKKVLRWHLEGQNLLTRLKDLSPLVHGKVWQTKNHYEKTLESLQLGTADSGEIFQRTLEEFQEILADVVKSLSKVNIRSIAHEAAADWLLRCPLDFPDGEQNA